MTTIHHHERYDMHLPGLAWVHPFDGRKFSRALAICRSQAAGAVDRALRPVAGPVTDEELGLVHSHAYLDSLAAGARVAEVLEVPLLGWLPDRTIRRRITEPMRYACRGTCDAVRAALNEGSAFNLGGGFHHAHADHGEGFCLFADIPLAVILARQAGLLASDASVAIIDVDAHRGNGVQALLTGDPHIHILDLFNAQAYPGPDADRQRWPHLHGLRAGMGDDDYLRVLERSLDRFLDERIFALAIVNGGTDVLAEDRLGGLNLSPQAVHQRDRTIITALRRRNIPWAWTTSGGYSATSHRLIAQTLSWILESDGQRIS